MTDKSTAPTDPDAPRPRVSLRDYFAAAALTGLSARDRVFNPEHDATEAYLLADAMLTERERR